VEVVVDASAVLHLARAGLEVAAAPASDDESDLPDLGVRQCVLKVLSQVKFPAPKTGR
jgi:hypothetical protein